MIPRRAAEVGCLVWALVAVFTALVALPNVSHDAWPLVALASFVFPACAATAGWALQRHRDRLAGTLLVLSVATPTYMAYLLNVPALLVGVAVLMLPSAALGGVSE